MPEAYFSGFEPVAPDGDAIESAARVPDPGGHELPFGHIDGRAFEVLAWRLKRDAVGPDRVRLMQGTGERGRDVVVYDGGRVETIVQCKRLGSRMNKPAVVRELMKVALHDAIDPDVLDGGVRYELWASAGFTEPAEDLLRGWPATWAAAATEAAFGDVRGAYAAFSGLAWSGVRDRVRGELPGRLSPVPVGPHDVTAAVRAASAVHDDFFVVRRAVDLDDLEVFMGRRGLRHIEDADVRYLLDRIEAVPGERRHGTGFGFLLGVPEPLLAAMTQPELLALIEGSMAASYQTLSLLVGVVARCVDERVSIDSELGESLERKTALAVLRASLVSEALKGLVRLTPGGEASIDRRHRVPEGSDLWERVEHAAGAWWDDLRAVIDAGEPEAGARVRGDGAESDAALRYRLCVHSLDEYGSADRETFTRRVVDDLRRVGPLVEGVAGQVGGLVPDDVIVVSDLRLFDAPASTMARFFDLYRSAPAERPSGAL